MLNSETMSNATALAHHDGRSYFERAFNWGVRNGTINDARVQQIRALGAKGIVQIAGYFGSIYLRHELESAMKRMVYLISLALEFQSKSNLAQAAHLLAEQSILTFSKAGSDMLRNLHVKSLVEKNLVASDQEVRDFLNHYSLKMQLTAKAYERRMQLYQEQLLLFESAQWLGISMGLDELTIEQNDPASIIRSCLFTRSLGTANKPRDHGPVITSPEFLQSLATIEKEGLAKTRKRWTMALFADVPKEYQKVVQDIFKEIVQTDLKQMTQKTNKTDQVSDLSENTLLDYLSANYFYLPLDIDDLGCEQDYLASREWQSFTQGKRDDDSISTLLLCVAAGQEPRILISETVAKTIIKRLRKIPPDEASMDAFLEKTIPVRLQRDVSRLWLEDLLPGIRSQVLSDYDVAMERALRFLREHCCLKPQKTGKNPS